MKRCSKVITMPSMIRMIGKELIFEMCSIFEKISGKRKFSYAIKIEKTKLPE